MTSLLVPLESVRGMTCLDRTAFTTTVELPVFKFHSVKYLKLLPILKKYLFKTRNFKPVESRNNETVIYLNPMLIKTFEDFMESEKKQLLQVQEQFGIMKVMLKYDNWQSYDILRAILPVEVEVPTSFSIVGHIVHLNLRDMHLPYKTIIGQVYLDTISTARTVLNKTSVIDTTFRNFIMEILAGDKDTITTVKENGCIYELDFSQVYWNTRLGTEHRYLITFMKSNDVLDFLRTVFKTDILNRRASNEAGMEHVIMNLPALAVEFLDVFFHSFNQNEIKQMCCQPPTIHLYCFVKASKNEDACKLGQSMVEQKLNCTLSSDSLVDIHYVRNVSVSTEMIRVSFLLTESILKGEEPAMKKLRMENNINIPVSDNIAENNGKEEKYAKGAKEQKYLKENKAAAGCRDKSAERDQLIEELRKEIHQCKLKMMADNAKQGKRKKMQKSAPVQTDTVTSLVKQMQI
ncbi:tRNA (guanine(37)-N1)-methyltransferase [Habropoda laboriosa]|uniref:tRNA (Guanine(37)-N1)-methyltransferase n=1 Tax=Habropoda laboriosa TaxID=597456 RepID=A0A0L7QNU1_9HYME|nr:tRNA (guanine(37)-N1)-methyltransferase [Habropoda laboriosa]